MKMTEKRVKKEKLERLLKKRTICSWMKHSWKDNIDIGGIVWNGKWMRDRWGCHDGNYNNRPRRHYSHYGNIAYRETNLRSLYLAIVTKKTD